MFAKLLGAIIFKLVFALGFKTTREVSNRGWPGGPIS